MAIFVIPEVVEIDLRFFDQLYSRKVLFDWLYRVGLLLRVVLVSCCSPLAISLQLLCKFEYQKPRMIQTHKNNFAVSPCFAYRCSLLTNICYNMYFSQGHTLSESSKTSSKKCKILSANGIYPLGRRYVFEVLRSKNAANSMMPWLPNEYIYILLLLWNLEILCYSTKSLETSKS